MDLCGHRDTPLRVPLFERAVKGRHALSEPRYGTARRINGSAVRARMPNISLAGVGPLDTGPDPEPHGLGIDMAYCTPGPGLPVPLLLEVLVPARIDIDDRNMAKPFAHLVDLPGIIGRVHEIVEIGHTPGGHHRQRDRDLAVMDGCRGEDGPQRHTPQSAVSIGSL